jgi:hypothetical protein
MFNDEGLFHGYGKRVFVGGEYNGMVQCGHFQYNEFFKVDPLGRQIDEYDINKDPIAKPINFQYYGHKDYTDFEATDLHKNYEGLNE